MNAKNIDAKKMVLKIKYLFPPLIGLAGVLFMLLASRMLSAGAWPLLSLTPYPEINLKMTLQLMVLPVSFLVIGLIYLYDRAAIRKFFRRGELDASAEPIAWLGIRTGSRWVEVGRSIAIIITAGTAVFMAISVITSKGQVNRSFFALLPLAFIFSATNAWSEEIFTRFAVVAGLDGKLPPKIKYGISAAIFGIPHYFGTPGGFVGVLMAGFMGWLLAKAVHETKGIFWAWFIHFVQDVVIFTASIIIMLGAS